MARQFGQKLKLLHLAEILWNRTDESHPMTTQELIAALSARGISAERKSLYSDLEELRTFGFDVESTRGKSTGYYLASRPFELVELKLLVDAVQSSKFITEKKSRELIGKLESLTNVYEARSLSRQVYVTGRIKTMNESIYYAVDEIHRALDAEKKISFLYYSWNVDKQQVLKRDGKAYTVSPYALLWEGENYYLVAFDDERRRLLHFRVDKMLKIRQLDQAREGKDVFEQSDVSSYARRIFGMFGGEEELVTLSLAEELVGVVIDRFGTDVPILRDGDGTFRITVRVVKSPQFYGWLSSLGGDCRVLSPESVRDEYVAHLKAILDAQK